MKRPAERDPVLRMIDAVLSDLSVRTGMYVGRRHQDGDATIFVIQTGEDGRYGVTLPDLASDTSIQNAAAEAQAHLAGVLRAPVPLCPRHDHGLIPTVAHGELAWVCPEGEWQCALGDYEELTWPQLDVESLAPILFRRLHRRGIGGGLTVGVERTEQGLVAEIGVIEETADLIQAIRDASAPLPVAIHREKRRRIRVSSLSE
jgi:hypothetical protein